MTDGPTAYECECCERDTYTAKKPGIGYVCDDCIGHWDEAFGACRDPFQPSQEEKTR